MSSQYLSWVCLSFLFTASLLFRKALLTAGFFLPFILMKKYVPHPGSRLILWDIQGRFFLPEISCVGTNLEIPCSGVAACCFEFLPYNFNFSLKI